VHAFFEARRPQFGGKTLEQYLEQLRIAVRMRERESAGLATFLARSPERACERISGATTVVALTGLLGGAAIAWGQHGHTGSHDEGHRAAQACATEFEQVVGEAPGLRHGVRGRSERLSRPMHVLELKDRLKLTAEQEAKMQHLMHAMFAESKPKSARLLEPKRGSGASSRSTRPTMRRCARRSTRSSARGARYGCPSPHAPQDARSPDEEQRRIYHEARWGGR